MEKDIDGAIKKKQEQRVHRVNVGNRDEIGSDNRARSVSS